MKRLFIMLLILSTIISVEALYFFNFIPTSDATPSKPPIYKPGYTPRYTPMYTPVSTPPPDAVATAAPVIMSPADIRFENFTANTKGEIKLMVFGETTRSLSDFNWIVRGEEIGDYSKIWVDYDIGSPNTMIKAGTGEPMSIKTGESWTPGAQVPIRIIEKSSEKVVVEKNLIVQ